MGLSKMTAPKNPDAQQGAIKPSSLIAGLLLLIALLVLSGWKPYDRLTWLMEVLPVMLVLPILYFTITIHI